MYNHRARIYLHHTDVTGRLFFANQLTLVHEAREYFLEFLGFTQEDFLEHPVVTFPVVHAQADYKAGLKTADVVDIAVRVDKIGETSVTFAFTLLKNGELVGTSRTVNVTVDKRTGKKMPIPSEWRARFQKGCKENPLSVTN